MDALTLAAGMAALSAVGAGWHWRRRAQRAEAEAGKLRGELLAERHAASHDPLTGLPNRRAFYELGAALVADHRQRHLVAAVLDLDHFKQINDRYGHAAGDEVLTVVARRFAAYAGNDLVARLGGDEFAALLSTTTLDEHWLHRIGQRLAARLAAPMSITGCMVVVTASVGLAPVDRSVDLTEILCRADVAMYRAKTRPDRTACFAPVFDRQTGFRMHDFGPDDIAQPPRWLARHPRTQHAPARQLIDMTRRAEAGG